MNVSDKNTDIIVKVVIGVAAFLTGQAWNLGKTLYKERKLKRALQTEIEEMPSCLLRNLETLKCMIQLSCLHELANYGPVQIPVHVHAEHFPEINLKLSRGERISINAIYNLIYQLNLDFKKIVELSPACRSDPKNFESIAMLLDTAYRNLYQVLLLIQFHRENIDDLDRFTKSGESDARVFALRAQNDEELIKLSAEAKKEGSASIRNKYQDGAISAAEVAPTPPPMPGRFYFDTTGIKYKCLEIRDGFVFWMQLESQLEGLTVDAVVRTPLASVRHYYEITDRDEKDRLERRCAQLLRQK